MISEATVAVEAVAMTASVTPEVEAVTSEVCVATLSCLTEISIEINQVTTMHLRLKYSDEIRLGWIVVFRRFPC